MNECDHGSVPLLAEPGIGVPLTIPPQKTEKLQQLYDDAMNRWVGCNWQTTFGPRQLNLNGVRAHQARLMSEATSGSESAAWLEATQFLESLENDARAARTASKKAVLLVESCHLPEALVEAQNAVSLESKHLDPVVWKPLLDAIAAIQPSHDSPDKD